ncbi:MAG: M20 family metallopeptidase [Deltaproteobacteria bacterium]|nr:M20 family metallopeptidase [Deltaproteobacteria bacterium]
MISSDLANRLDAVIDSRRVELHELARSIHGSPELAFAEHRASAWIVELCSRHGRPTERPFGGLDTALAARAGKSGPHVAVLAEYDALPEIGHACGHNLIAAGAVGAFLALATVADELGGRVTLVGTPAEEGGGGKIKLLEAGAFRDVDAAMMFHPFDRDLVAHPTLATYWLEMTFKGRPAHAAVAPHDGASALTACMDTFRLVDGQRVHFRDGVRVHGFIKDGGEAVNIIPERAVCQFSVRSFDLGELERVRAIVERCARAAAMASDVEVSIESRQGYRNMRNNLPMAERFAAHLESLGRSAVLTDPDVGTGSTDMGDVSYAVPAIHPWLAICDRGEALCHQRRFAECAVSERGLDSMILAAKAMARTAAELLVDPELRRSAKSFFDASTAG